jgi:hypothetical protein
MWQSNEYLALRETTQTFIFGDFTPISWDSTTNDHKPDNSGKSFLFSLTNPRNIAPRKFILISGKNAIYCDSLSGPCFSSNRDIAACDNCNTTTNNWTNLGGSYVNDTGIDGRHVFTGEYNFKVKEVEVFTINI